MPKLEDAVGKQAYRRVVPSQDNECAINLQCQDNPMKHYKNILLSTDLFSEISQELIAKAKDLAQRYDAELSVLHVVDYVPMLDPATIALDPFNLVGPDQIVLDAALHKLMELGEILNIPDERLWFENGQAKDVIVRIASENAIDLIVIGAFAKHGFGSLLGSTASSVIMHAPCDVLAVRLHEAG